VNECAEERLARPIDEDTLCQIRMLPTIFAPSWNTSACPLRLGDLRRRHHVATVATVVRQLEAGRQFATGQTHRGESASSWLHSARVETSKGAKTPLETLSDPLLAAEALNSLIA
jgi:hypothetical protein